MVLADGKVLPEEIATVEESLYKAGVKNHAELEDIKKASNDCSVEDCYGQLAFLSFEQKKFVSSMLGTICSCDGDIDDRELELWRDICKKCDLPVMNNRQAIDIFLSY